MRAAPTLFHEQLSFYDSEAREKLALTSWRALSAIWLAVRFGGEHAALGYIARFVAMAGDDLVDRTSLQFSDALFGTLETAIDINKASLHAAETIDASVAACNSASPHQSAGKTAIEASNRDLELLAAGATSQELALIPLWHGYIPPWHRELWYLAQSHLGKKDEHWDVWFAWYEDRLRGESGIAQLEIARVREVKEAEWSQGALVANAKIRSILDRFAPRQDISALSEGENDENAPPIAADGDQLRFARLAQHDDTAVAGQSGMAQEYANIRTLARALQSQVSTWVDSDCHPDWHGLKKDVARLARLLKPDINNATQQISVVWAAGLAVAEYLDQDRQLRTDPSSGNAPALPLPIRNKLSTFVQTFGAWLLEFPTVRQREENAQAFTSAIERLNSAKQVVTHVRRTQSLQRPDLELLEELLKTASGNGPQATKARLWSFATLKRLLFAGGKILALSAAHSVADEVVESSILLDRLKKLMIEGESAIAAFVSELPSSSREALLHLIERLRDGGNTPA